MESSNGTAELVGVKGAELSGFTTTYEVSGGGRRGQVFCGYSYLAAWLVVTARLGARDVGGAGSSLGLALAGWSACWYTFYIPAHLPT